MATAMLVSCNKNNGTEGNAPENGFRATIEQPASNGNGSRTHINPDNWNNGTFTDILWTSQDLIRVANGQGTMQNYQLTAGENTSNGVFNAGEPNETFFVPNYAAIYPASNNEGTANSISGTTATFNIPNTQTYKENSFAEMSMPMVAYSETQVLEFKNVFGGICIPMVGNGLTVTKIVLTSANENDHLYGVFTADCTSATPMPNYVSGGYPFITLDCSATPVTLNATTPTYFCIMVPPASLSNGFTVEAYNGSTRIFNASTTANPNITRSMISKVSSSLEVLALTVTTNSPTFISTNSALGIGTVSGETPVECGVVYALASALTTPANDLVIGGTGVNSVSGTFAEYYDDELSYELSLDEAERYDAKLTGLEEDKVYFVRAWAKDAEGAFYYGDPIPFATRYDYFGHGNNGKSRGTFTINENGDQVRFSMGNLQYQASTSTWRFAEYQFEYVGSEADVSGNPGGNVYANGQHPNSSLNGMKSDNHAIAENYSGWIDMFGWGTSGINDYTPIATCWQPWSTSVTDTDYNPYGALNTNLNSYSGKADWGYNAISNGGNTQNSGWRTLQGGTNGGNTAEWSYLFNTRTCTYCYARVKITDVRSTASTSGAPVNGIILFPDIYEWPALVKTIILNTSTEVGYWSNWLTEAEWSLLEHTGAVFLPAGGYRSGIGVDQVNQQGCYWSSTSEEYQTHWPLKYAYGFCFEHFDMPLEFTLFFLNGAASVRLVCPAE